ncbi:hypothetical protein FRB94_005278 [Tulasnella sp. JGI-2019a]|nr:hypothetical protein FRB94_005278 [Tulasnella sp. JGI-2019a]KAG9016186.1 hypothetical protein FRB93_011660 [Tulasnella sp. JGI-2019a]KAG9036502.1 hypothetical protein FRB95_008800 [Tulasnella sp. JGI-2019a]
MSGSGVKHDTVANNYLSKTFNLYRNLLPQTAQTAAVRPFSDQGYGTDDEKFPRRAGGDEKAAVISTRAAHGVSLVDHGPVVPTGSDAQGVPRPSTRK